MTFQENPGRASLSHVNGVDRRRRWRRGDEGRSRGVPVSAPQMSDSSSSPPLKRLRPRGSSLTSHFDLFGSRGSRVQVFNQQTPWSADAVRLKLKDQNPSSLSFVCHQGAPGVTTLRPPRRGGRAGGEDAGAGAGRAGLPAALFRRVRPDDVGGPADASTPAIQVLCCASSGLADARPRRRRSQRRFCSSTNTIGPLALPRSYPSSSGPSLPPLPPAQGLPPRPGGTWGPTPLPLPSIPEMQQPGLPPLMPLGSQQLGNPPFPGLPPLPGPPGLPGLPPLAPMSMPG